MSTLSGDLVLLRRDHCQLCLITHRLLHNRWYQEECSQWKMIIDVSFLLITIYIVKLSCQLLRTRVGSSEWGVRTCESGERVWELYSPSLLPGVSSHLVTLHLFHSKWDKEECSQPRSVKSIRGDHFQPCLVTHRLLLNRWDKEEWGQPLVCTCVCVS